mmetsp:Transcript_45278/g.119515  ORF Transcript_45278/g.119515 Transcript_45278/m.119515 type:complete len:221 (-) Transcript_45278:316-978(-)
MKAKRVVSDRLHEVFATIHNPRLAQRLAFEANQSTRLQVVPLLLNCDQAVFPSCRPLPGRKSFRRRSPRRENNFSHSRCLLGNIENQALDILRNSSKLIVAILYHESHQGLGVTSKGKELHSLILDESLELGVACQPNVVAILLLQAPSNGQERLYITPASYYHHQNVHWRHNSRAGFVSGPGVVHFVHSSKIKDRRAPARSSVSCWTRSFRFGVTLCLT